MGGKYSLDTGQVFKADAYAGGSKQTCSRPPAYREAAASHNKQGHRGPSETAWGAACPQSLAEGRNPHFSPGWMLLDLYEVQSLAPRGVKSATDNLANGF